ncbi:MAG: pyridoxal-dependent decarboxylase [Armatimonadetes bacterium]|nr:pyridoxal-dependent decarboxylase [Armatimonadota bacterium]
MPSMPDPLHDAFDSESFRALGHGVVDLLADYLAGATRGDGPVLPWKDPAAQLEDWPVATGEPLEQLLPRWLAASNHLHHPGYLGHQVTAPLPLAALGTFAAALLNGATAVYEMGPANTAMEQNLVHWLAAKLGFGADADGILTSGGSLGNLTALLAARQAKAGYDVWSEGQAGGAPLAMLVGEQAHYSVARALQVMGMGRPGLVKVPADERYKTRPEALHDARRRAEADGRKVIGVAVNACCTATGSFDPLGPIADFCEAHGLWLHVDGAHGAAAALSPKYRHLIEGIDRADAVVWDAHKMLMMPALCTAVLFRDGRRGYEAFAQEASYLLHRHDPRDEWYNLCGRTFECTKTPMALPLYLALSVYGEELFADYVTSRFDLGRRFGAMLAAEPDFELPVPPECNIVCFRYVPPKQGDLDALQVQIRQRIIASGAFHLVQTRLATGIHLRVTIISPFTTDGHLQDLIEAVRVTARPA